MEILNRKPPNWDSVGDTVELLYIRNEREHASMLRLQAEMLENARKQAASNAKRIHKLYKIQARLRKRFIEVNSFIKDCIDKKRIADKKVAEEQAKHEILNDNIAKYRKQVAELSESLLSHLLLSTSFFIFPLFPLLFFCVKVNFVKH